MAAVIWIERALALAIHGRQLAEHGGASGCVTRRCSNPRWLVRSNGIPTVISPPDLAALAASLAHGLARNHPFVDGNKRTAQCAIERSSAFEWISTWSATEEEKYVAMLTLATGKLSEDDFARPGCARCLTPRAPRGVHEKRGRYTVKRRARRPAQRKRA